jgi:hypothetical protein
VSPRGEGHDSVVHDRPVTLEVGEGTSRRTKPVYDVVGILWTVACAAVVLVRALRPGVSLGPFDLLSRFGLTYQPGVTVHNAIQADQIQQFVPWTDLAWHQVHSGVLPLWNPYNVLGTPLAFNWQSSVFSVPELVSYLFPVSVAFTAVVLTKLIIAGIGAYVLCRVLGLGPLSAAFGGTVFELSGPMIVHAGWPHTSVTCWGGWILAAAVLLIRGRHRLRYTALLGLVIALAVYGGHPESLVVLGGTVVVFIAVYLAVRARSAQGAVAGPVRDVVVAAVCGLGLCAPLLLPGVQLALSSARRYGSGQPAYSITQVPNVLVAGLQGNDFKTAAYVGVIALVLALVGARVAWHRPEVPALAVAVVVTAVLTFVAPADRILALLPGGQTITWSRAVMLLALALAVLGAFGLEAVVTAGHQRVVTRWALGGFAGAGAVLVVLFVAVRLGVSKAAVHHQSTLVWPAVQVVVGLALVGALWWWRRPASHGGAPRSTAVRLGVAGVLLAVETGFLLSAGVPFWSVSPGYFAPNPAVTALQKRVGSSLVGYGTCRPLEYLTSSPGEVGIRPNANIGYGIHEFVVYDPILPRAYYQSWLAVSGVHSPAALTTLGVFCARFTSAEQARIFGVSYVLEPSNHVGPTGSVFDGIVGRERLYGIPGSASATLVPPAPGGGTLATDAPGVPVATTHPSAASWRVVENSAAPQMLRLRLSAVPGWHATIDGRPLSLRTWATGLMLEARVPAGRHVIELQYWPSLFSAGLVVAGGTVLVLVLALGTQMVVTRRRRRPQVSVRPVAGGVEGGA